MKTPETPLRALLVEDEPSARSVLCSLLQFYPAIVTVVAEAEDATQALTLFKQSQPNVLFLDINLPQQSGFDLLAQLPTQHIAVIFTTAYSQFAVKAFEVNAVDYLVKPIELNALERALEKVQTYLAGWATLTNGAPPQQTPARVLFHSTQQTHSVAVNEIVYIEASGSYAHIHLANGTQIMVSKSLNVVCRTLPHHQFIHVHRSYVVNTQFIAGYSTLRQTVKLQTGQELPMSRRRISAVKSA